MSFKNDSVQSEIRNKLEFQMTKYDKLAKSSKFCHAPASAGAGSAKAGIQNYLKTLDSRLRGNDVRRRIKTFYKSIKK
jgi:hypothetical protein